MRRGLDRAVSRSCGGGTIRLTTHPRRTHTRTKREAEPLRGRSNAVSARFRTGRLIYTLERASTASSADLRTRGTSLEYGNGWLGQSEALTQEEKVSPLHDSQLAAG